MVAAGRYATPAVSVGRQSRRAPNARMPGRQASMPHSRWPCTVAAASRADDSTPAVTHGSGGADMLRAISLLIDLRGCRVDAEYPAGHPDQVIWLPGGVTARRGQLHDRELAFLLVEGAHPPWHLPVRACPHPVRRVPQHDPRRPRTPARTRRELARTRVSRPAARSRRDPQAPPPGRRAPASDRGDLLAASSICGAHSRDSSTRHRPPSRRRVQERANSSAKTSKRAALAGNGPT